MSNRVWTGVLAALAAAAAIIVVVLAMRVRSLSDEIRRLRFQSNLPQVGDVIPSLRRALLGGDSVDLARPGQGRRQVWFVFDTRCPICRASLVGWSAAYARLADDASHEVIGLALDSVERTMEYRRALDLPFPVAVLDDPLDAAMYRIPGVPLTMVLDEVGRILFVRSGLFDPPAADSMLTVLGASQRQPILAPEGG